MGYTKGEWKVNKNWMGTWTIYTDEAHIADVDRHFNAKLIAAAPELYEACQELVYSVKSFGRQRHLSGNSDNCAHCHLIKQAVEAIAAVEE